MWEYKYEVLLKDPLIDTVMEKLKIAGKDNWEAFCFDNIDDNFVIYFKRKIIK